MDEFCHWSTDRLGTNPTLMACPRCLLLSLSYDFYGIHYLKWCLALSLQTLMSVLKYPAVREIVWTTQEVLNVLAIRGITLCLLQLHYAKVCRKHFIPTMCKRYPDNFPVNMNTCHSCFSVTDNMILVEVCLLKMCFFLPPIDPLCLDIDECFNSTVCGPCSNCTNVPGKHICECEEGYVPSVDPAAPPDETNTCEGM